MKIHMCFITYIDSIVMAMISFCVFAYELLMRFRNIFIYKSMHDMSCCSAVGKVEKTIRDFLKLTYNLKKDNEEISPTPCP